MDPIIKQAEELSNLEALGAASEAIDFLKRELRGMLLVISILIPRLGGRVTITQEEFDAVDPNTKLRVEELASGARVFSVRVEEKQA